MCGILDGQAVRGRQAWPGNIDLLCDNRLAFRLDRAIREKQQRVGGRGRVLCPIHVLRAFSFGDVKPPSVPAAAVSRSESLVPSHLST